MTRGLVVSAPSSGAGKTTATLGLLRALRDRGEIVTSAKSGPDYIDPAFHSAATAQPCLTLDPWCANADQLRARAAATGGALLVVEGAMGLFDGAPSADAPLGRGSTADTAQALGLPVVLVVDGARRSQTTAAIVQGLAQFRDGITIAGVILNRVGSERHESMLRRAVETVAPVFGTLPRDETISVPSRHLGLKQAAEIDTLDKLIAALGRLVARHCDLDAVIAAARPIAGASGHPKRLPPLGQRIAVARDEAFGFAYPHMLFDWQNAGAEILPFSPLADEAPEEDVDAIFLPGGYPELYGGRLASADGFRSGMIAAAESGSLIYGECGGFMVLGNGLVDEYARQHAMLGLLDLETSFAERKLHLGYRSLTPISEMPFGGATLGHEFHYSTVVRSNGDPLFMARDAADTDLGPIGLRRGTVMGSYAHCVELA